MRNCKKMIALLCAMLFCMSCTCCLAEGEAAATPGFYEAGLKVVSVMNEMVQNRDYLEIFMSASANLDTLETSFNTGDYDKPVAVYSLKQADALGWLKMMMSESEQEKFNALSPALQEQLLARASGLTALSNMINGQKGVDILSLTSALQAIMNMPELEIEEPEYYLFLFEKGVPVLVTLSWHHATGMFLVLSEQEAESHETIQALLQPLGIEVLPVDIPQA
ncbi:MAG: hypothetical protein IKZ98_00875 [Clostridia bacterium]|nr:hypothetical protein [Clostridia bacterium]